MKIITILMISVFYLSFSGAGEPRRESSSVLGYDKALHFTAGYVISDTIFALQRYNNALLPFLVPAAAGAGKELYDSRQPGNRWDWNDMKWNVIGVASSAAISLGCEWLGKARWWR